MKKLALLLPLLALPLHADLASDIRSSSGWVGYSVPIEGRHTICSSTHTVVNRYDDWDTPASALLVMYRVEGGVMEAMRLASPECRDIPPVRWLPNVDPRESIRLLEALIDTDTSVGKKAVTALALHRDAQENLLRLARRHPSSKVRGQALFWVGQRAGTRAAETLSDAVDNDPDEDVKAKAVFGISQMPDDQSVPLLIKLLNTHRSRQVRKKAAFWLSQKNDPRALEALEAILRR
jgi:HEAT repeat protein